MSEIEQQQPDTEQVRAKRRLLLDAIYAICGVQKVIVDSELARRLEHAWDEYDAAIRASVTDA